MKTHLLAIIPLTYHIVYYDFRKILQLSSVLCTSINYWRNPVKGVRRNIDISTVFSIGIYNSYNFPHVWIPTCLLCFILWRLSIYKQKLWIHSLIHFVSATVYLI